MCKILRAYLLGTREFRLTCTTSHECPDQRAAYDWGREWAHRLTFRRYEPY